MIEIPDDLEEAQYVIAAIAAGLCQNGAKWSDFAVLFRLNAQSRLFEEKLRRARIPYRLVGGRGFFDRREIKDVLAHLTALMNRDDDFSLLRILNTPVRGIGVGTIDLAILESSRIDALPRLKHVGFGGDSDTSHRSGLTCVSRPETATRL